MFCGTNNSLWNILHIQSIWGTFHKILSAPQHIVMHVNNVMELNILLKTYLKKLDPYDNFGKFSYALAILCSFSILALLESWKLLFCMYAMDGCTLLTGIIWCVVQEVVYSNHMILQHRNESTLETLNPKGRKEYYPEIPSIVYERLGSM